jgi:hypothetical protein
VPSSWTSEGAAKESCRAPRGVTDFPVWPRNVADAGPVGVLTPADSSRVTDLEYRLVVATEQFGPHQDTPYYGPDLPLGRLSTLSG